MSVRSEEATAGDDLPLPALLRRFRRAAYRLRDGLEAAGGPGSSSVSIKGSADADTVAQFDPPASFPILGALLRPFISRSSELNVHRVRDALSGSQLLTPRAAEELKREFDIAADLGIEIELDGHRVTAQDIFFAYGDGLLFGEDREAKLLLQKLSVGPMQVFLPFAFHSACLNFIRLIEVVADVVVGVEKAHPEWGDAHRGQGPCIYCLGTEGDFETEEHVIPEAFGQDDLVLIGSVCASCNNRLSVLDNYLVEGFEPLAFLRTVHVDLTKKGKFPRARFRDADIEKTGVRKLRLREKGKWSSTTVEQLDADTVKLSMNLTGKKPFNPVDLARALYKVGLALVAHDAGPDVARERRYDTAREFMNGSRDDIPGHLWMRTRGEPAGKLQTQWWFQDAQTIVTLNFYGLWFVFDLDAGPARLPLDNFPEFTAYALSREPTGT